jgi:prevent-host-death family protein
MTENSMVIVYAPIDNDPVKLRDLLAENRRVVLTSNGEPAAVLLSVDDYRSMQATISLAQDPAMLQHVVDAADQMSAPPVLANAGVSDD